MQETYFIAGLIFCGVISLIFFALYLGDVRKRSDIPLFRTEWTGLGNGLSGWRISRPLAFAVLGVAFGLTTAVLIAHKIGLEYSLAQRREDHEYELKKQRESDERKYRDAELARKAELDKAKLPGASGSVANQSR